MKNEITDLNSQIETTDELLNQLQAELADIPNRRASAVNDADSAALISLSHRAHDLPVEIQMTKIRLERLRVQRKEATLPALDDEIERQHAPIPALQKAFDEADKALKNARYFHTDAIQQRADTRQAVAEMKAGITRLMHEKTAS
jgi:chromosome segregation ATPase